MRLATRRLSDLATRQCQRPQVEPADTDASPGPPVTRTRARCLFAAAGDDQGAGCAGQQDSHPVTSSRGSPRGSPLKKVPRRAYGRLGLSVGKAKRLAVRMSASQAAGGAPRSSADSRSSPSASPNPKRRKTMQRQRGRGRGRWGGRGRGRGVMRRLAEQSACGGGAEHSACGGSAEHSACGGGAERRARAERVRG